MNLTVLAVIVIVVAVVVVLLVLKRMDDQRAWPFYAKKPLSNPEQVLYHRLVKSLPECVVLAQVQASRILGVKKGANFGVWNNRINRLSLDYVVCLKDATVVAAIELDDATHSRAARREADKRKARALESAGITLIRWTVNALPDEATIRAAFTR